MLAPTFILTRKPQVYLREGRWWVAVAHVRGTYMCGWPTQVSAMNSARLIAQTSRRAM